MRFKQRTNRIREGGPVGVTFIHVLSAASCVVTLYPMYYVLILSLSDPREAIHMKMSLLPQGGVYWESYRILLGDARLWRSYLNTLLYVAGNTLLMLATSVMGAYPLTYRKLYGRKLVNLFFLIPMYFSGGLIPTFLLITKLGLYNTPWAMILPTCFSVWNIILVKSYFNTIPESLREAARIDGANNYQILLRVFLPAAKPILAVVSVYTVVGVWNSWFNANVYLPTEQWQPLQMYLRRVLVQQTVDVTKDMGPEAAAAAALQNLSNVQMRYAMIIFTTLPVLLVYPFLQKYFVQGIMLGSLKE